MKRIPLVAIVGRPNVGKSSLFNLLAGHRISIVDDSAGVTRDRIYAPVEWSGHTFMLVDTGGVDFSESNAFAAHIREQVNIAIDLADTIIFLTSGEAGIHPSDMDIANLLRKSKKPIVLTVNKLDNEKREQNELYDFYKLKLGEPIGISCTQKRGIGELLDAVLQSSPVYKGLDELDSDGVIRIAIVGKPNAGKSSVVNRLLGENRVMVSDIAGTTRDSIDTPFRYDGREYILTDTAGIRRKRSVEEQTVEHYAVMRALAAIRNSDVSVLVVDAVEGLTEQDVRLAGYIHEEGKPSVIVINKWDIAEQNEKLPSAPDKARLFLEFEKMLSRDLAFMAYFKPVFISALTGQRIGEIMKAVDQVTATSKTRITTGKLNQLIFDFATVNPTRAKIKYATQVAISPPTFAIFVSKKELLPDTYMRYIENCLRKSIDFTGTPVRMLLRDSSPSGEGVRRKTKK